MPVSKPHWMVMGAGALSLALIGAAAVLGGPQDAWLKTRALWAGQLPPKIVSLEADPKAPQGTFIVTIRNPAVEDVVVTGYVAEPWGYAVSQASNVSTDMNAVEDGAGAVPMMTAQEQHPDPCDAPREVRLPRPMVVEPKRAGALRIRPWEDHCPLFAVRVTSDHGTSRTATTMDTMDEASKAMRSVRPR